MATKNAKRSAPAAPEYPPDGRRRRPETGYNMSDAEKERQITFLLDLCDSMSRLHQKIRSIYGELEQLVITGEAIATLQKSKHITALGRLVSLTSPPHLETDRHAVRLAHHGALIRRDELLVEFRRTGVTLAGGLRMLNIEDAQLQQLLVTTKGEIMENAYTSLRAVRCALEVRRAMVQQMAGSLAVVSEGGNWQIAKGRVKARRRRDVPLTDKQATAISLLGIHNGNQTAAAEAMGVTRATYDEHLKTAQRKLQQVVTKMRAPKVVSMPLDERGQVNLASDRRSDTAAEPTLRLGT